MAYIIEIRDTELLFTNARMKSGSIRVEDSFRISFINQDGTVNMDLFKTELKKRNINKGHINLVVNNRTSLSKVLLIPKVDRKRMNLLVKSELMSSLNIKEDCVVDYLPISKEEKDGVIYERVLAIGLLRSVVSHWEIFFKRVNLKLKSIETFASTFARFAQSYELINPDGPLLMIDITKDYTRFFLYRDHAYSVHRTVYAIADNSDEAIMRYINLIRLIANSLLLDKYQELERIKIFGDLQYIEWLQSTIHQHLEYETSVVSFLGINTNNPYEIKNHLNSLGVLL